MVPALDAAAGDIVGIISDRHRETITLSVSETKPNKVFTLDNPDRLVIDVPMIPGHPDVDMPSGYKGKLIGKVRYGRFDTKTSRFVFETNGPVRVLDTRVSDKKGGQLVVGIAAAGESSAAAPATSSSSSDESENNWPKAVRGGISNADYSAGKSDGKPHREPKAKKETKEQREVAEAPKPKEPERESRDVKDTRTKKEAKASKPVRKNSKPVIVIDPGHGGVDPGTEGASSGVYEKDIVLAAAKELQMRLIKTGHYKVVMTREGDTFIMLRKRVEIARKAGADLFISIHADSAEEGDARGLSVYTLSEKASDQEAEALAARENKADVLAGMDLTEEREDVAGILISLAERETKNRSATLADTLVTALDDRVRLLPNSHRFAGFAVLKAPDVPSVLVEIGFLSHPKEEKLINSKAYREKLAAGIVAGIDRYFRIEGESEDR